jgi:hypothetical protein
MKDREFLCWLHERLELVHKENSCMDYMHKLRAIISATPIDRETPNIPRYNTLEALRADEAPKDDTPVKYPRIYATDRSRKSIVVSAREAPKDESKEGGA